jgi:hypothetical protein
MIHDDRPSPSRCPPRLSGRLQRALVSAFISAAANAAYFYVSTAGTSWDLDRLDQRGVASATHPAGRAPPSVELVETWRPGLIATASTSRDLDRLDQRVVASATHPAGRPLRRSSLSRPGDPDSSQPRAPRGISTGSINEWSRRRRTPRGAPLRRSSLSRPGDPNSSRPRAPRRISTGSINEWSRRRRTPRDAPSVGRACRDLAIRTRRDRGHLAGSRQARSTSGCISDAAATLTGAPDWMAEGKTLRCVDLVCVSNPCWTGVLCEAG